MQKFEILYNRAFSASTQEAPNTVASETVAPEIQLFQSQQNLNFQQEYFLYLQQNGVSLVNDLNIKGYLNDSNNEELTNEFINYLSGTCSYHEFIDILYDNKKLSDYFNDYYKKFKIYSNQGLGKETVDKKIDLNNTKSRITHQDKLYTQTNSLTNYIINEFDGDGNLVNKTLPNTFLSTDFNYFSGNNESYYINILMESGRKTFFSDDFSQYYQDCCDGTITYNKYTYVNSISQNTIYGNYSTLKIIQNQYNLTLGPSKSSIDYLKGFLPINFLSNEIDTTNSDTNSIPVDASTIAQINQFADNYGYITIPQNNSGSNGGQILNFMNFSQFQQYFNFEYLPWMPQFSDPSDYNKQYIYQQTINVGNSTPTHYNTSFQKIPDPINLQYQGQQFDKRNNNLYKIRINHTSQQQAEKVILKWEPCSMGNFGTKDGFNVVSFNINGNVDPNPNIKSVTITFNETDLYQDVFINLYENWPARTPIVFSLRPESSPSLILEYLIVYIDEFYKFNSYSSTEQINVTSFDMCKLMYNCFVDRNYNDNFLEFQRPNTIPVNFGSNSGLTLNSA